MMNIMVVDDNKLFRYALRSLIERENTEYRIVCEAINGKHALKLLMVHSIDILITDMSMPQLNGVQLIQEVTKLYRNIKIIVLSNFDDFEFVKEALKLGAKDYILKNEMESTNIIVTLDKIRDQIYEDRKHSSEKVLIQRYGEVEKVNFMKRIISGGFENIKEIKANMALANIHLHLSPLVFFIIQFREQEAIGEKHFMEITEKIYNDVDNEKNRALIGKVEKNQLLLIIDLHSMKSEHKMKQFIYEIAKRISCFIKKRNNNIAIGISDICMDIRNAPSHYKQCKIALEKNMYEEEKSISIYHPTMNQTDSVVNDTFVAATLKSLSKHKELDQLIEEINALFNHIYIKRWGRDDLEMILFEVSTIILHKSHEMDVNIYEFIGMERNLFEAINNQRNLKSKKAYIVKVIKRIYEQSRSCTSVKNPEVKKVVQYIQNHYMKDLSLTSIAEIHGFSPNHLSNCFKKEMSMSIVDFIKLVRIEKAKTLMEQTNYKAYEVANKVGFKNTSYFCTVFKEVTGMSSKNYKISNS